MWQVFYDMMKQSGTRQRRWSSEGRKLLWRPPSFVIFRANCQFGSHTSVTDSWYLALSLNIFLIFCSSLTNMFLSKKSNVFPPQGISLSFKFTLILRSKSLLQFRNNFVSMLVTPTWRVFLSGCGKCLATRITSTIFIRVCSNFPSRFSRFCESCTPFVRTDFFSARWTDFFYIILLCLMWCLYLVSHKSLSNAVKAESTLVSWVGCMIQRTGLIFS